MEASSCPRYEDYRGVMIDIALEDTSLDEPALVDEVRRHIRACPHCRHEFNGYRSVVTLFTPPPVSEEEIEEIAANVRRRVLAKVHAYERRRKLLRRVVLVAGVACVLLGSVALLSLFGRHEPPREALTTPQPPAASANGASAPPAMAAITAKEPGTTPQPALAKEKSPEPSRVKAKEPPAFASEVWQHADRFYTLSDEVGGLSKTQGKAGDALLKGAEAIALGEGLLTRHPDFPEAIEIRRQLLLCYEMVADEEGRQLALDAYLADVEKRRGPDGWGEALADEALRYLRDGQNLRALRAYDALLERFPKGKFAGIACRRRAALLPCDRQAETYRRALEEGEWEVGQRISIYENLIVTNINRRRYSEALADAEAMERAATSEGERTVAASARAVILARSESAPRGIVLLKKVVAQHDSRYTSFARTELERLESLVARSALGDDVFR